MKEQINAAVFYISTRDEIINGEIRDLFYTVYFFEYLLFLKQFPLTINFS